MTKVKESAVELPSNRLDSPTPENTNTPAPQRMACFSSTLYEDNIENSHETRKNVDLKPRTQEFTASAGKTCTLASETQNIGQDLTPNYSLGKI